MRKLIFAFLAVVACMSMASAQTRTIKGLVVDANDNEPLVGATVEPIGGGQAMATDIDGRFAIQVPANVKEVKVSYVGYTPQTVPLRDGMVVHLSTSAENLDDLVVVAYGKQKKSSLTGSVSQVKADKIAERPVSGVTSALEGTTSGITISGTYGEAGSSPTITIRGVGSVNGSNSPLYVIDGVPFGGNVTDLNPDDVESISVLKDAASAALYGNRASNGVILITTKKAKEQGKIKINFKTTQGWYERAIPEYDRAGIPAWMDAQFMNYRNGAIISTKKGFDWNDPEQMQTVNNKANDDIVQQWLYLNIFDKKSTELFDDNGKFDRTAPILGTYAEDLDWWDQAIRKGYRGEYTMNAMGATTKSDYRFSLGYLTENGYMRDNKYDRITGAANVNMYPVKWFKTGLNMNVSHQKNFGTMNGVGDGSNSYNNAFMICRYISPIYPVHLHDVTTGNYLMDGDQLRYDPGYYAEEMPDGTLQQINTRNQYSNRNVIWESKVNSRRTIRNTMNATAYMDFNLPYGFVATIRGNLNTRNSDNYSYGSALIGDAVGEGSLSKTLYTYKNYTFQQQLTWNQTYADKHFINVLLAHENYANQYDYTYVSKRGQAFEGIPALSNFSEMKSMSGYRVGQRTESFLARVQYNYDDRYNVEGSFRRDGSSRFAKDVRWGNFGSVGANWVFSNESFIKDNLKWLNNGKLFVNWGQVGNDGSAGSYSYYQLMGSSTMDNMPGYYLTQLAANDLKWETSEAFGIGLEATLFDRWNLSVEYYNKMNKDLIFSVNLPASAGPNGTDVANPKINKNIGSIRNRGVEVSTDVTIYKTRDWNFNAGVNLSFNQNRVTKLPDENKYLKGYTKDGQEVNENGYLSGSYKISEGHSRYDFFMYHWEGVDMMTGNSLYTPDFDKYYIKEDDGTIVGGLYQKDANGQLVLDTSSSKALAKTAYTKINGKYYVMDITNAKRVWAGDALPKMEGSFNLNAGWKGLKLSALCTFSVGGKLLDETYRSLVSPSNGPSAVSVDVFNSWSGIPAGMTETSADRINTGINPIYDYNLTSNNYANCDRWLVSRNWFCLKNINLSYELPKKVIRPMQLSGLKVYFQAENLFIKTARSGLSPQMGVSGGQGNYLVPARVFTFGLSLDM